MNRQPYSLLIISFFLLTSIGCSSKSCGPKMTFREWIRNHPTPIRDLFSRGDRCSDCAVPAGQIDHDGFDCPDGNCNSGQIPAADPGYYPSAGPPAGAASLATDNRVQAGYPPAPAPAGSEIGSGVKSYNSNAELELPPMYGKPN
jgi:hypothetical protein